MKSTLFRLMLISAPLLAACSEQPIEQWPHEPGVAVANVNMRSGPAVLWPVLKVIRKGAHVEIVSRLGDWLQISNGTHAGYVAGRYIKSLAVVDIQAASAADRHTEKFLPAHKKILQETGWFEYANTNIDSVEYYDWPAFHSPSGPVFGLAALESGRRVARIALKDRSAQEAVATIVHEAAHFSGFPQIGTFHSQDTAFAVEAQFRRALEQPSTQTREVTRQEKGR